MEILEMSPAQIEAGQFASRYDRARSLRLQGLLDEAEDLLNHSVNPPSIYHGHYRELFLIFRERNKSDLKCGKLQEVIDRVRQMALLEGEMISAMLDYWSKAHGKKLAKTHFDGYRKLKISDCKAMLKAAEAISDNRSKNEALKLLKRFPVEA